MRRKEGNDLLRGEAASVGEAGEDAVDTVERLRDGQVRSGLSRIDAAKEDVELGSTGAVRDTDCACELDEVGGGDVGAGDEWRLLIDNFVDSGIGVEVGLDALEYGDRTVSTSTTAWALESLRQ